jgi:hypothetical protein
MPLILSTDIAHSFKLLTGISVVVGVVLLVLSFRVNKWNRTSLIGIPKDLLSEILRDMGVAFFVAVIVTGVYELHVRQVLDTEKLEGVLSTVLKYNIPPNVWDEVSGHVLDSKVIRRNVAIDFEIRPDSSLPPSKAYLIMTYSYDLYSLSSNSTDIRVQHKFVSDYHNLARWEDGQIKDSQGNIVAELKPGEEQEPFLKTIHLEPAYDFRRQSINGGFIDASAVHVTTRRREITNLPGIYPLGIPVLMEGTREAPIRVSVTIPASVEIEPTIDTQWEVHTFSTKGRQGNKYMWNYVGVLLPGQGFDVSISQPLPSLETSP